MKINIKYLFPKSLEKKKSIKTNFKIFETLDYYDGLTFKIIAKNTVFNDVEITKLADNPTIP